MAVRLLEGRGDVVSLWCEVCDIKVAATILDGRYLCGACGLKVLQRVSDQKADPPGHIDLRELPVDPGPWDLPWDLPSDPD